MSKFLCLFLSLLVFFIQSSFSFAASFITTPTPTTNNQTTPTSNSTQIVKTCNNYVTQTVCQECAAKGCLYDEQTGDCYVNFAGGRRCVLGISPNNNIIVQRRRNGSWIELRSNRGYFCLDADTCHLVMDSSGQCVCANDCGCIALYCTNKPGTCQSVGSAYSPINPGKSCHGDIEIVRSRDAQACRVANCRNVATDDDKEKLEIDCYRCHPYPTPDPPSDCSTSYTRGQTSQSCSANETYSGYTVTDSQGNPLFVCGRCDGKTDPPVQDCSTSYTRGQTSQSCSANETYSGYTVTDSQGNPLFICGRCDGKTDPPVQDCSTGYTRDLEKTDCRDDADYLSYTVTNSQGNNLFVCGRCLPKTPPGCRSIGHFNSRADCEANGDGEPFVCKETTVAVGNGITCWVRETCQEITDICHTIEACQIKNSLVIPRYSCLDQDHQNQVTVCGDCCTTIAAPWFQTVGGNLFAQANISGKVGYDVDSANQQEAVVDIPSDFVNAYFARQAGPFTTLIDTNTSGLPMTKTGTINNEDSDKVAGGGFTQRLANFTHARSTNGAPNYRREDFTYFQNNLNYALLNNCDLINPFGGTAIDDNSDHRVCKVSGDATVTDASIYQMQAGQSQVIFVEGNLTLDLDNSRDNAPIAFQIADGAYLAFIVKGDITVTAAVGTILTKEQFVTERDIRRQQYSNYDQTPQISGVFIADGVINFPSYANNRDQTMINQFTRLACDKKLTLAGTFVGWQGINMNRNFKGCVFEKLQADLDNNSSNYPDYNELNPVLTFTYRPDFVINTPSWMRHVIRLTQEVN